MLRLQHRTRLWTAHCPGRQLIAQLRHANPRSRSLEHPAGLRIARHLSTAGSFPLDGRVGCPMYGVVDRSSSGDVAITDAQHGAVSYQKVYRDAAALAAALQSQVRTGAAAVAADDSHPPCVAVLCANSYQYVAAQWACWSLGRVFVPLSSLHPQKMLEYFVQDSSACAVMFDSAHAEAGRQLASQFQLPALHLEEHLNSAGGPLSWPSSVSDWSRRPAILIYTSGTTGPPKGVPITHGGLCAGMRSIADAWQMQSADSVLHCLPLHHVHGVINALATPLAVGAHVNMLPKFDAEQIWKHLLGADLSQIAAGSIATPTTQRPTMFMAVPTMYAKLAKFAAACHLTDEQKVDVVESCRQVRVMISGSAPLPDPILQEWEQLTGHRLLERYGMTEIQMGLTNPLHGNRIPGAVGQPFPGMQARIVDVDGQTLVEGTESSTATRPGYAGEQGDLLVKGPTVFHGYWNKPDATKKSFTEDGWFLTGDTAVYENEVFRIVGRTSVDIIKSGGYKISALDVERCLLSHPRIADCAVIGLPDTTYGEVVTAVIVLEPAKSESEEEPTLEDFSEFVKQSLPPYVAPRQLRVLGEMPRNAMGKVNKKELARLVA